MTSQSPIANRKSQIANRSLLWLLSACAAGALTWFWWPVRHPAVSLPEVARAKLLLRDGHWYWRGGTNLFTGYLLQSYPSGARLSRSAISNGLLNGLSEAWYTNGQLQVQEHFKDGVSNGLRRKWYENGTKLSEASILDGKVVGVFRRWYKSGQLAEQIPMKTGEPDGVAYELYASGFLKAKTRVRLGRVLARKTWKDGERQAPADLLSPSESASASESSASPPIGGAG